MYKLVLDMPRFLKWSILLLMDVFWVPVALLIAFVLHSNTLGVMDFPLVNRFAALTLMGISALLSIVTKTYRIQLKSYERRAVGLTAFHTLALGAFAYLLDQLSGYGSAWSVFVIFMLSYFLLAVSARVILLQALLAVHRLGSEQVRVLIYGAGATGRQLAAALRMDESVIAVGYIDDNRDLHGSMVQGLRVYSSHNILELAQRKRADRVLLAMPSAPRSHIIRLSEQIQGLGLVVQSLPSFAQLTSGKSVFELLEPVIPGKFLGRDSLDDELSIASHLYRGKNVLVSGAGGSIGSELCRQLVLTRPSRLILFESSEHALYTIQNELKALALDTNVEVIPILGSVIDPGFVRDVISKWQVDVILHAAAYKHVPIVERNVLSGIKNNVLGTHTLSLQALQGGVERFIFVSTDKAVEPNNVMGATKRVSELIIDKLAKQDGGNTGTVFSMVRFGNVIGSSGSVLPLFRDQINRGGPVTITHPEMTRFFMTISEAARLVLLAGSIGESGDLLVLDMGEPVKINELAEQMIQAAGLTVRNADNPRGDIEIVVTGIRPGEKLHEKLMIGEGEKSTTHPKIIKANEPVAPSSVFEPNLAKLLNAIESGDEKTARQLLFDLATNPKNRSDEKHVQTVVDFQSPSSVRLSSESKR